MQQMILPAQQNAAVVLLVGSGFIKASVDKGRNDTCWWLQLNLAQLFFYRQQFCSFINPLVPDAHYSERPDKPFFQEIQLLEVELK